MSLDRPATDPIFGEEPHLGGLPLSAPALPVGTPALGWAAIAPAKSAVAETARIMIVDDQRSTVRVVRQHLVRAGYRNLIACTLPEQAEALVAQQRPDLVLLDVSMSGGIGFDIMARLRATRGLEHLPVIILAANNDKATRLQALHLGATDLLSKPVDAVELILRVRNTLVLKAHHDHLLHDSQELAQQVREQTEQLARSRLELIHCLARAAEYRDNETGRHVIRVGRYAGIIARHLGFDAAMAETLELAAPLHDMGKLGIPDAILLKPGPLTADEMAVMREHCHLGARTFEPLSDADWQTYRGAPSQGDRILARTHASPILAMAARIALTHHEKWDGSGYPQGLSGEQIPLEGRITAVADVFDALTSQRPYKQAFPLERCFGVLREGRGRHFDPAVLDAFFASQAEVVRVYDQWRDTDESFNAG